MAEWQEVEDVTGWDDGRSPVVRACGHFVLHEVTDAAGGTAG
jgi:hypothetical protein